MTFAELDTRSTHVADGLRGAGVSPGDRVGLCVARGQPAVTGMLGILKAGAAYVPLDPDYPSERLQFMCEDSRARVVLCDAVAPARGLAAELIGLEELVLGRSHPKRCAIAPNDLAYVIYTSGSTGKPKGVMITHRNVLALIDGALPLLDVDARDRWSLFTSYSFDVSVWEMWMALLTGACGVAVPADVAHNPQAFCDLLANEKITILNQVPSVFRHLAGAYANSGSSLALRYVIFAGEALDRDAIRGFLAAHHRRDRAPRWINMYGITETTVHSTFRELTGADIKAHGATPIGRPLPHVAIHLRDSCRRSVPKDEPGEIWVSGDGVGLGYLNRPELTAERFVQIDVGGANTYCYRSGDLAVERGDGELEYLGRMDSQVKLRGFRIELGEIEQSLMRHPAVAHAAVVLVEGAVDPALVAVIVPRELTSPPSSPNVRSYLAGMLPAHMVPSRVLTTPELPLTPSGKLDRAAVKAHAQSAGPS